MTDAFQRSRRVYKGPTQMARVEVAPVSGRRELAAFVSLPYGLHRHDPCFSPPLRSDVRAQLDPGRNAFFGHAARELFLARSQGRVTGRIAAIHDRAHERVHGDGAGFFGFFEAENDPGVAAALLEAAAAFLRARGCRVLRGPMSPSINDETGLLVQGFGTPSVVMMPHNPPYYRELVEGAGLRKAKDLLAFERAATGLPERLLRATEVVERRLGVSTRTIEMRRFGREVELVQRLFNEGWQHNWGAVPLDDAEVAQLAAQLKPIVVPELVVFAEQRGEPIGFAAAIPDLNLALRANPSGRLFPGLLRVLWAKRRITRLRVLLLGVLPGWQGRGVDALLYRRVWDSARARGYEWAEAGWVLEDNHAMINGLRRMGFRRYKTYRVYERPL
jgi:GNAT superfamily N-acetyltransferase